jgi:regulator of sigma E protease
LRFGGELVPSSEVLSEQTKTKHGQSVEVIYSRRGVEDSTTVNLRDDNNSNQGYLGVGSGQREQIRASWSAPIVGVVTTGQFTLVTFQGLGDLLANVGKGLVSQLNSDQQVRDDGKKDLAAASNSVAGPIGILGVIFPAAGQAGFVQLAFLTAIISLTLAVMNILPIPALDGGRWFVMTIFKLLKKPLTKEREEKIQATGFMILMALVIVVTVADVGKLIK